MITIKLVPALEKMDLILVQIANESTGMTFQQIIEETGFNKSTVYSLLYTLEALHYVYKTEDRRYFINSKLHFLGEKFSEFSKLKSVFEQYAKEFLPIVNETCQLGALKEDMLCYIAKVESVSNVYIKTSPGERLPAYATAMGKLLLQNYNEQQLQDVFKRNHNQQLTMATVQSVEALQKQIQRFKQQGYMLERGEVIEGFFCVAAPITNVQGDVIAAVSYTTLDIHFELKEKLLSHAVQRLARQISNAM